MPATHDPRPIGVFDSGIGGLTAVRELFRQLPHESVVYFGDTARLPYGNKSKETVTRFSVEIASFLVRQNVKCIVVACNTASSHALEALRVRWELPVIGVIEPAAKAAVAASPHGLIGVVGTLATVGSGAYLDAIHKIAPGANVLSRACPLFVPLVEEGWLDHKVTHLVAEEYLAELRAAHLESLILGCTHYPLLAPLLHELMGPGVHLVDSGAEAARATAQLLAERGQLAADPGARGVQHHFFLSDEPRRRSFARVAQTFLGRPLPHVTVVDQTDLPWFERAHAHPDLSGGNPA
ncbi:MAG: glutamate racemase [Candidatus Eisenbacteria bacterium]|uniref:Glutamate racemase n=1 Tax=Eiseniibacteriota bacterium TaxID=2212470 RepID=A0A933SEA0_UNCEI|nr:glutamate racemase [Candidatus Eisenbacteria bacterium]